VNENDSSHLRKTTPIPDQEQEQISVTDVEELKDIAKEMLKQESYQKEVEKPESSSNQK
jgi:hypothetical protein